MAFFDWLQRMIEPTRQTRPQHNRRRGTPPTKPASPAPIPAPSDLSPEPSVRLIAQPTPTKQIDTSQLPTATLVVRLVDERDRPLQPALVLTGPLHGPVHLRFPEIPGYALQDIHGFTQEYLSRYSLTSLVYVRQWGQPIIAYLVDYDTNRLLTLPQIHRGRLGQAFNLTPPAMANYHIFQAQGSQRGAFSDQTGQIVYYYRRNSWQTVQRVNQYVLLDTDHAVFDEPNGRKYGYHFPAHSLWRLFIVITLTNGDVWYNLGGEQWLIAQETTRREHPLANLALPQPPTWHPQSFDRLGSVDYVPGKAVTCYQAPYGEVAGMLEHGAPLDIRGRIVDDQHLVWYQIGPKMYINARYVRLVKTDTL